jgi:F-type H+-transporting ATPase subunit delta
MATAADLEGMSQQYARAAYQHTTEGWLDELRQVWDRLATAPELFRALDDTDQPFLERQAQLDGILPTDVRPDVRNFLYVLLKDGHVGVLEDVIADLTRFGTQGPSTQVARVISAVTLTTDEQAAFRQRIASAYGDRVDVEFRVDVTILGGAIVQVGDKIIDGSIVGKLNALHDRLVAAR